VKQKRWQNEETAVNLDITTYRITRGDDSYEGRWVVEQADGRLQR
jgi:hypothetical protein